MGTVLNKTEARRTGLKTLLLNSETTNLRYRSQTDESKTVEQSSDRRGVLEMQTRTSHTGKQGGESWCSLCSEMKRNEKKWMQA